MDGRYDADGVNGGDLASVTRFLRRQWWVIALSTALALVAGIAALSLLPASYAANTVLLLKPISVADKERATLNMDTELQLAKSTLVAQDAAAAIGDAQTSGDVQRRLTLYVPANSTVMHLTFTAEDAQSARAGSQAVATSYLTAREESARKGVESQIAGLQSQRDQIASTADTVRTQLAGVSTGTPDGQRLLTDLDSALRRVAEIDAQIASLRTVSINPGEVITAAALPQSPASPNASKVLGSALILGLLAGLVLAALRQTVQNRKINSVEHLGSLSGVDRVADLQGLGGPAHKRGARTTAQTELDRVLARVAAANADSAGLILVTSAGPGAPTAAVAAALAEASSTHSQPSLLIVRNRRSANLAAGAPPLTSTALTGLSGLSADGGAPLVFDGVSRSSAAGRHLGQETLSAIRSAATSRSVVLESLPIADSADASTLAPHVDCVVVVTTVDERTEDVVAAMDHLVTSERTEVIAVLGPEVKSAGSKKSKTDPSANASPRAVGSGDKKAIAASVNG